MSILGVSIPHNEKSDMSEQDAPVTEQKAPATEQNVSAKKGFKVYALCGFVSTALLAALFTIIIGGLAGFFLSIPLADLNRVLLTGALGKGGVKLLKEYSYFVGEALAFLLILLIVKPWRPYLKSYGTGPSGNRLRMLLIGLAVGLASNVACVLVAVLTGCIHIEFKQFSIVGFVAFFVYIFIQASTEELISRGFVYQRLGRTYGTAVAVIGSAALFSLAHAPNPGISPLALFSIFVIGVQYALMVRYFDSIWLAMGAHTAWNLTQNIIFGLPNSGNPSTYSFFGLVGASTNGFAYDTVFGVEATVFAVLLDAAVAVAIFVWGRRHAKNQYDIWEGKTGWFY